MDKRIGELLSYMFISHLTGMPADHSIKQKNYRVVVMGTAGVGKSSIINQFIHNKFTDIHKETIEELHRHVVKFETVSVEIDILDTSGSHQFPAMRKLAIGNGDAFLLVYAVDDKESFESVKLLREEITEHKTKGQYSIIVVANKSDLPTDTNMDHVVQESIVCIDWEEKFVATSAKTSENIEIIFQILEHNILQRVKLEEKRQSFFRRISMPIMKLAKTEKQKPPMLKAVGKVHSYDTCLD